MKFKIKNLSLTFLFAWPRHFFAENVPWDLPRVHLPPRSKLGLLPIPGTSPHGGRCRRSVAHSELPGPGALEGLAAGALRGPARCRPVRRPQHLPCGGPLVGPPGRDVGEAPQPTAGALKWHRAPDFCCGYSPHFEFRNLCEVFREGVVGLDLGRRLPRPGWHGRP